MDVSPDILKSKIWPKPESYRALWPNRFRQNTGEIFVQSLQEFGHYDQDHEKKDTVF